MKFSISQKWLVALIAIVLPALLLLMAAILGSGVCIIMTIMFWIALAMIVVFIPYYKEKPDH
ncbi:MAG: hypothetical protein LLG16_04630 [Euryarchaeota archaeon]|nr:hypothetical protein [Euryarchaeota archaeon]